MTPRPSSQPPLQEVAQAQEAEQSMPVEQLLRPPQVAVQSPVPHWMPPPQLPLPVQVAVHLPPAEQSRPELQVLLAVQDSVQVAALHWTVDGQALVPVHSTVHSPPVQLTPLLQVWLPEHSIVQRAASQLTGAALQSLVLLQRR